MMPFWYPLGMKAYGSTIAVWMHLDRPAPRTFWEAGSAQSDLRRVSRSGPMVPVAPAAARVWQEVHPLEAKSAFPAAVEAPGAAAAVELLAELVLVLELPDDVVAEP